MDRLLQDVRYALRVLVKSPSFSSVAVLTMAIGIGANATVFSFVSALLLRPAPGVRDPRTLVALYTSDFSSGPYGDSSYPDYLSLKFGTTAFDAMAAEHDDATGVLRVDDVVERVRIASVSGEYFSLLGVRPALGRLLDDADARPEAQPAAVISHSLWRRAFAKSPAVLGSSLTLNGRTYTIVGVGAEQFTGLDLGRSMEVWTPLVPPPASPEARGNRGLSVIGRLSAGATLASAEVQVSSVAARLARDFPETNLGTLGAPDQPRPMIVLRHTRLPPQFRRDVVMLGAIILAAVALVLVIACANIASLMLSRATARDKEMAIRLALGAGRGRLIRQLMTESIILGLAGGAMGLLLSLWTADVLPSFFPADQAQMLDARIDATALAFVIALSLVSSMLFGLAPALQSASEAAAATLRTGSVRSSDSRAKITTRRILVAGQIAVAVVLLISAALLTQSIVRALSADPGYGTREAVLASVELPLAEFEPDEGLEYFRAAAERIRSLPGVEDAAFVGTLPLQRMSRRGFRIPGYQPQPGEDMELHINTVGPRYFETMQVALIEGRSFDSRDQPGSRPVAIVNELLAQRYFGGRAVGEPLTDSSGRVLEIVGVVRTGRNLTFQNPPVPVVHYALAQEYRSRMTLVARTTGDAARLAESVRRALRDVNRDVPVFRTVTLATHMSEAMGDGRLTAALVGACGGMALLLATVGVYGVIAYSVARRMREIGVRVALGARPWHVVHLVLGEGVAVTAIGITLGIGAAALSSRALQSMLYGVSASDPMTYAVVPAVLALVALLAACPPVRRALRVEPTIVLRQE